MNAPPKKTRGKQKRGELTKVSLIRAAMKAVQADSIFGLRFSQVARIAGVPQPLVDYHFKDLETLLLAMVTYGIMQLKEAQTVALEKNSTDPRKAFEAYMRVPFELAQSDPEYRAVWTSYSHLASTHKAIAELHKSIRTAGVERITLMLQAILLTERRSAGTPGVTTNQVANAIQGLLTGCASLALPDGGDYKRMADIAIAASYQLIEMNFPRAT
ncbi:MAG TPA: TetR/AcrR family transcriptional regulator [Bdellovibrionales bacterium]|nr:TetR/AcrR family transcriptional regulator [Bdellovibrionales bacterium]